MEKQNTATVVAVVVVTLVLTATIFLNKYIIEAVLSSNLPEWLKVMLLRG